MTEPPYGNDRRDLYTVPDLLAPVLARFWWVVVAAIVTGSLFFGFSFLIAPTYEVSVTVAPANHENSVAFDGGGALNQLGGIIGLGGLAQSDFVRNSLGVLRSRALIANFISRKQLIPELYEIPPDSDPADSDYPTLAEAVNFFEQSVLDISEDKLTSLIEVSMQWQDRQQVTDWANEFVALANEMIRNRTRENARSGNEFLAKELEKTSSIELRQSIYRLMEGNIKMVMLANTRQEFAFVVLDPAVVPAEADFVWPNRLVIAFLGMFLGAGITCFWILWRHDGRPVHDVRGHP